MVVYRDSNEYWIEIEKHSKWQVFNQGKVYFVLEILFLIEPVLLFSCLPETVRGLSPFQPWNLIQVIYDDIAIGRAAQFAALSRDPADP